MTKPIFWHQGLFLQPQHFQLCDLYTKSLFTPLYKYVAPSLWGVVALDILESSLLNHIFEIKSGEFLFNDMTHCIIDDNACIKPRSFEKSWEDGGKTFKVYIGIKKWSDQSENVSIVQNLNNLNDESSRFVSLAEPEEIPDMYQNGPEAQIKRMSYHIKIFWETELDQISDYLFFPIAELMKKQDEIILSKKFIHPCVSMSSSKTLYGIIREIKDQIVSKCHQLEAVKRDKSIHTSEFGSRDMIFILVLRSLNRYVPLLAHYTETEHMHPWVVYGMLRQIVGELSSFSQEVSANGELSDGSTLLSKYDHKKLFTCFDTIQKLITTLLEEITAGPDYIIPLNYDGTYFTAEMTPQVLDLHNRFYIVVSSEGEREFIIESFQNIAKLSSRESLPLLIAQSLSGVKFNYLATPPQELPRKTGAIYFQIDHNSKQWINVIEKNNIAIYWDTAPEDIKLELIVIKRN